jgi:hypothetical protein
MLIIKPNNATCSTVSATQVSYSRSKFAQLMEKFIVIWVDDLNKSNIPLIQAVMTPWLKKKSMQGPFTGT